VSRCWQRRGGLWKDSIYLPASTSVKTSIENEVFILVGGNGKEHLVE